MTTPHPSVSTNAASGRPQLRGVLSFFGQHPVWSAFIIFVAYLLLATAAGLVAPALAPQAEPEFVALIIMAVLVAAVLTVLGWWWLTGFNGPARWRALNVLWVPVVIVCVLPFLAGFKPLDANTTVYFLVAYALTGFMEEGLMRGLVLQVLAPLGVRRAVILSSLLFALIHVGNLLYRNPAIVLAQMVGAFVHGIGLAAIRLRTNTIWFVVILHGLHDLFLHYTRFPSIALDVVQVTLLMFYGIYLLRGRAHNPVPTTA